MGEKMCQGTTLAFKPESERSKRTGCEVVPLSIPKRSASAAEVNIPSSDEAS